MASIGVSNKIKRIVNKHLTNIPGGIIEMTDDASLIDDLNADSLDSIEIVMQLKTNLTFLLQMMKQKEQLPLVPLLLL